MDNRQPYKDGVDTFKTHHTCRFLILLASISEAQERTLLWLDASSTGFMASRTSRLSNMQPPPSP
eukprot:469805-Amphidinium_carterae.1